LLAQGDKQKSCRQCAVADLCLPVGLLESDLEQLEHIVKKRIECKRGDALFHLGEEFRYFYAIHSGSFKSVMLTEDGREQVSGFYLKSELIGLDAVDTGSYCYDMVALENAVVCAISFEELLQLAAKIPMIQRQVIKLMSQRIRIDESIPKNSHAQERLAAFLLNLTARLDRKQQADGSYTLPMSRQDIGNYLGLALETVSRLFSRFQKLGILEVKGKSLYIYDFRQLQILVCH